MAFIWSPVSERRRDGVACLALKGRGAVNDRYGLTYWWSNIRQVCIRFLCTYRIWLDQERNVDFVFMFIRERGTKWWNIKLLSELNRITVAGIEG